MSREGVRVCILFLLLGGFCFPSPALLNRDARETASFFCGGWIVGISPAIVGFGKNKYVLPFVNERDDVANESL